MAEKKKESERTLELAQRVAAQEAAKPADWTGGTYGQQVQDTLDKILNRQKFSYNLNADPLYNQYKDQYIRGGKLAMQDTMGQAAALTGGYGNSYASTAGNQAYQGYLTGLNDRVPELYSLALSRYNAEGDAMRGDLGLLQGMQDQEYAQWDRKNAEYRTDLDRLDALYSEAQKYDYQNARDAIADAQWQAEFDEAVRQWNQLHPVSTGGGGYRPAPGEEIELTEDEKRYMRVAEHFDSDKDTGKYTAQQYLDQQVASGYLSQDSYNRIKSVWNKG